MDTAAWSAERTLLVVSPVYLQASFAQAQWATAFHSNPTGEHRTLLPVRVEPCEIMGLLGPVVFINLVGLDEKQARSGLLSGVRTGRAKPPTAAFPGLSTPSASKPFPGVVSTVREQAPPALTPSQSQQKVLKQQEAPCSVSYHSCFLAHAHQDQFLAQRLHDDLEARGVQCWLALRDMKIGARIRSTIDQAIQQQEKLLLLLSQDSINSAWVEDEVEAALEYEKREQRELLFPVRLDESVMQTTQAWAAKLRRTRHIGDFTNWTNPQEYQPAFDRLLQDLKKADREKIEDGGN
jgi:hypothetical protein